MAARIDVQKLSAALAKSSSGSSRMPKNSMKTVNSMSSRDALKALAAAYGSNNSRTPLDSSKAKLANSIDLINASNAPQGSKDAATKKSVGVKPGESWIQKGLNLITKPKSAVVATFRHMGDPRTSWLQDVRNNIGTAEALKDADWFKGLPTAGKIGVGLVGDIAADPLTYLAGSGLISKAGGAVGLADKAASAASKSTKLAEAATVAGDLTSAAKHTANAKTLTNVVGTLTMKKGGGIGGLANDEITNLGKLLHATGDATPGIEKLKGGLYWNVPGTGRVTNAARRAVGLDAVETLQIPLGRNVAVRNISKGSDRVLKGIKTSGFMSHLGELKGAGNKGYEGTIKRAAMNAKTPEDAVKAITVKHADRMARNTKLPLEAVWVERVQGILDDAEAAGVSRDLLSRATGRSTAAVAEVDRLAPGLLNRANAARDAYNPEAVKHGRDVMGLAGHDANAMDDLFANTREAHQGAVLTDEAKAAMDGKGRAAGKVGPETRAKIVHGQDWLGTPLQHPTDVTYRVVATTKKGKKTILGVGMSEDEAMSAVGGDIIRGNRNVPDSINANVDGKIKQFKLKNGDGTERVTIEAIPPHAEGLSVREQANVIAQRNFEHDLFVSDWGESQRKLIGQYGELYEQNVRAGILKSRGMARDKELPRFVVKAQARIEKKMAKLTKAAEGKLAAGEKMTDSSSNFFAQLYKATQDHVEQMATLDDLLTKAEVGSPTAQKLYLRLQEESAALTAKTNQIDVLTASIAKGETKLSDLEAAAAQMRVAEAARAPKVPDVAPVVPEAMAPQMPETPVNINPAAADVMAPGIEAPAMAPSVAADVPPVNLADPFSPQTLKQHVGAVRDAQNNLDEAMKFGAPKDIAAAKAELATATTQFDAVQAQALDSISQAMPAKSAPVGGPNPHWVSEYERTLKEITQMRAEFEAGLLKPLDIVKRLEGNMERFGMTGTGSKMMPNGVSKQLDHLERLVQNKLQRELDLVPYTPKTPEIAPVAPVDAGAMVPEAISAPPEAFTPPVASEAHMALTDAATQAEARLAENAAALQAGPAADGAALLDAERQAFKAWQVEAKDIGVKIDRLGEPIVRGKDAALAADAVNEPGYIAFKQAQEAAAGTAESAGAAQVAKQLKIDTVNQKAVIKANEFVSNPKNRITDPLDVTRLHEGAMAGKLDEVIQNIKRERTIDKSIAAEFRAEIQAAEHVDPYASSAVYQMLDEASEIGSEIAPAANAISDALAPAAEAVAPALPKTIDPALKVRAQQIIKDAVTKSELQQKLNGAVGENIVKPEQVERMIATAQDDVSAELLDIERQLKNQATSNKGVSTKLENRRAELSELQDNMSNVWERIDQLDQKYAELHRPGIDAAQDVMDDATMIAARENRALRRSLDISIQADIRSASRFNKAIDAAEYRAWLDTPKAEWAWKNQVRDGFQEISRTLQAPDDIAQAIALMNRISTPGELPAFMKYFDQLTTLWKSWAVTSPAFAIRNAMSDAFMNYFNGVAPGSYRDFHKASSAFKSAIKEGKSIEEAFLNVPDNLRDSYRLVHQSGVINHGGQVSAELAVLHKRLNLGDPTNIIQKISNTPLNRAAYALNARGIESLRGAAAMHAAQTGRGMEGIYDLVFQAHFDYSDLNAFETRVMSRVTPFYTWYRKALPAMMEGVFRNPKAFSHYAELKSNIEAQSTPEDLIPGWMRDGGAIRLPWSLPGGGTYLMPDMPFKTLGALADPKQFLGNINPLLKLPVEQAMGYKMYMGKSAPFQGQVEMPAYMKPIAPLLNLIGQAKTTESGQQMVNDKTLYALEQMWPALGRARRLVPSEQRYQDRLPVTWANFLFGASMRVNTDSDKAGELYARQGEVDKIAQELQDLGYGGYDYWRKQVAMSAKAGPNDKRPYLTLLKPKGGLGPNSVYSNVSGQKNTSQLLDALTKLSASQELKRTAAAAAAQRKQ